ncbi:MAG: leucine-rich repeat domain-containing protein [Cellvibrionaceae bacterium]|nr:leucine-rich repeat domain-containing protein [Cellvibrionaceae bacterium]
MSSRFLLGFTILLFSTFSCAQSFTFGPANVVTGCDQGCPGGKDIQIPNDNEGVQITEIAEKAFSQAELKSVVLPSTIVRIGKNAFSENQLESINLPASLSDIGEAAFSKNQLTSISIPGTVTTIRASLFSHNKLSSLVIPSGVEKIESAAFQNNELSSIVIPQTVNDIGESAFSRNQLTSVSIPGAVTVISASLFSYNKLTSLLIPEGVVKIEDYAFQHNELSSVEIPQSVNEIGKQAFYFNSLSSVDLPDALTVIESASFYKNQLASISIPQGVTAIGDHAFALNKISSLEISSSVQSIGEKSFWHNKLSVVNIPDSVSFIDVAAFSNNQLQSVTLPDQITEIRAGVFYSNQLSSIDLPSSIVEIGNSAFARNKFSTINLPSGLQRLGAGAFKENRLLAIDIPSGIEIIESNVFSNNELASVVIPEGVVEIGIAAFLNNKLEDVRIPASAKLIRHSAFAFNRLLNITIPEGVESIESHAFSRNTLLSIVIPSSVNFIDNNVFSFNKLSWVVFEGDRPDLEGNLFSDNAELKDIYYREGRGGWPGDELQGITPELLLTSVPPGPVPVGSNFTINRHSEALFVDMPKKAVVFDIDVYATDNVEEEDIHHVANVLAKYLDNDQDGVLDQPNVWREMKKSNPALVIWDNQSQWESVQQSVQGERQLRGLFIDDVNRGWSPGRAGGFDGSHEVILRLISSLGYSKTYPNIFGYQAGSLLASAMDNARGGYFEVAPTVYAKDAWFTDTNKNCSYSCMVSNYMFWTLSSKLGAHIERAEEVKDQWKLYTPGRLTTTDVGITALLEQEAFNLPKFLPDGFYTAEQVGKPKLDPYKLSGTWYDPSESGHGIMLQVFDSGAETLGLTMTWFTFNEIGEQQWFYGDSQQLLAGYGDSGCYSSDGNYFATFPTLSRFGGDFIDGYKPDSVSTSPWGALSVCYDKSEDKVNLRYLKSDSEASYSMTRLTQASKTFGTSNDTLAALTGTWFNPSKGGQGLYLEVIERSGGQLGANLAWYGFREKKQMYFLGAVNELPDSGGTMTIPVYETSGAKFGDDFNPSDVQRSNWGRLHIERVSCNEINLRFEGADRDISETLRRLSSISGASCH